MRHAIFVLALLFGCASPAFADTFFLEIDYMVEAGPGAHSHRPTTDEVNAVIQMFACQGHTLVVDVSDAIPHYDVLNRNPSNSSQFFGYTGEAASFDRLKEDYRDHGAGWHYAIFGHAYQDQNYNTTGSSGLGELNGDDFLVSLGFFANEVGTAFDRASTLAHEFGHNLGLGHCGTMNCGVVGDAPINVASTMSYMYQLAGVRTNLLCQGLASDQSSLFKEIDYSHGRMCSLNENALDESLGTWMLPVDWNCSGTVGGVVAQDLNGGAGGWCGASGTRSTMVDYDEWSNIHSSAKSKLPAQLENLPEIACITADEAREVAKAFCPQPQLAVEGCATGRMVYLDSGADVSADGRCVDPYNSVILAHSAATSGSVFFLRPGTYDESGATVLNKPMKLFSVGTAVLR